MSYSQSLYLPSLQLLSQCKTTREFQQLHTQIIKTGLFFKDTSIPTTIAQSLCSHHSSLISKPTDFDYFLSLFDCTAQSSPFLYNTLIRTLVQIHLPQQALLVFYQMLCDSTIPPDHFTFPFVLKSCSLLSALEEGEQIHGLILKTHLVSDDVFVNNSLLHLYAQCGKIERAHRVFDQMPHKNIVSWNSMVDGFAKAGDVGSSRRCFDEMPERNVVSWNSMIGGYVKNCLPNEALELFLELQFSGLWPDEPTMVSLVSAVSDLGLLGLGKRAHGYLRRHEFSLSGALGVALINMYTRCGSISSAFRVFAGIRSKNVGHWTSMIAGFAAHGLAEASLKLFSEMLSSGVKPNYITFIGVLNASSHGGLVKEGLEHFSLMRSYGIKPRIQHYGCLVDLLGRSGLLEEAVVLIDNLPVEPGFVIWATLLAACKNHGNTEIAEIVAQKLIELDPDYGGCYVLLSNLYASLGRWEDFSRTRKMMEERGVEKVPGFSWIELDGDVHEFVAGDKLHPKHKDIYRMLDDMESNLRWAGYI